MKKQGGITLIALVITIVVLLILAAISIDLLRGDEGIILHSKHAKEETEIAEEKEVIKVSAAQAIDENIYGNILEKNLREQLDINIGEGKYNLEVLGDKFKITYISSNRNYYLTADGKVIALNNEDLEKLEQLQIGDYVDYEAQNSITSYEFESIYTGYESNQILPKENLQWRVFKINDDGMIELIAATSTTNSVTLSGALGYNNGVYLLNDYCKTLYGNEEKNATARSINMDDVEEKMDLSVWDFHEKNFFGGGYAYGSKLTQSYVPYQWVYDKTNSTGCTVNGQIITGILDRSKQDELTTETYYGTSGEIEQNMWGGNLLSENFYNPKYEELLCGEEIKSYWIASRGAYNTIGIFSVFSLNSYNNYGEFWPSGLFQCSAWPDNRNIEKN